METLDDLIAALDVTEGSILPVTYYKTLTMHEVTINIRINFLHYADTRKLYGLKLFISDDWGGELIRFIYCSGSYEKLYNQYKYVVRMYKKILRKMV